MPDVRFDRFYRYEDLKRILHAFAAEYPALVRLESIGQTCEWRNIWVATGTDLQTRPSAQ